MVPRGRLDLERAGTGVKQRLAENTFVIFTSDNGPHDESDHDLARFNQSGPLRGIKRRLTDGGNRVPMIAWRPVWVMTERQKQLWVTEEAIARHRNRQCLPDLIEPAFLAQMVLFLAADDFAMCTANNFIVDADSI